MPPAADGCPQAGDRLPGRCSHSRCQGRASGLSRPLNSRERARARHLACDWLFEKGRRRPNRDAPVGRPFPFPPLAPMRVVRRLGNGRGGASIKSSVLIGSLGTYGRNAKRSLRLPHAQLVRMSLVQVREAAAGVLRMRIPRSAPAIHLPQWFGFPENVADRRPALRPGKRPWRTWSPVRCPRMSRTMERGLGAGTPDFPSLRP